MSFQATSANDIPISQQHAFLDLAKEFKWQEVKRQVNAAPALVGVQPCGRQGGRRWSALHQAAFSGNADAVRFLLSHHAPTDAKTDDDKTPWDVAKNDQVRRMLSGCATADDLPTPARASQGAAKTAARKSLKTMKRMRAKKSKIAKGKRGKSLVYKGRFQKTVGGLTKEQLTKNKSGKIVSKRLQAHGKKSYTNIKSWVEAFLEARLQLGLVGFVAIKNGSPLYAKTMELYKA